MARILIAGDLCPWGVNEPPAMAGDAKTLFGDILPLVQAADCAVANLECPLIKSPNPQSKVGPVLGADVRCIEGIARAGFDSLGLANNHIMDHGVEGLNATLAACRDAGIKTFGAGPDLETANAIRILSVGDMKVGFLGMAEREFGMATGRTPGANPANPISFIRAVAKYRESCDFLIVLLHGGNEHYPFPRPDLRDLCRFMIEQGAGAVICQHSHIVGCYERYRDSIIVYGQGNFLFNASGPANSRHKGIVVQLEVESGRLQDVVFKPVMQIPNTPGTNCMPEPESAGLLGDLEQRSAAIAVPGFVEEQWNNFCASKSRFYLRRFGSVHRLFRALDRLTGCIPYFYRQGSIRLEHLNLIRCESHREVLINILSRDNPIDPRASIQDKD